MLSPATKLQVTLLWPLRVRQAAGPLSMQHLGWPWAGGV